MARKAVSPQSTNTANTSYLDSLLDPNGAGRKALYKLYGLGCQRSVLGGWFVWLHAKGAVKLKRARATSGPTAIPLNPLDSLGSTKELLGGLTLRQVKQIQTSAKKLEGQIRKLRRTPLIRYLAAHRDLSDNDVLRRGLILDAFRPDEPDPRFLTLINIHEVAKAHAPHNRPDFTRRLSGAYLHIRERTGHWHDKVADILNDLLPNSKTEWDEFNLKEWRKRHRLLDSSPKARQTSPRKSRTKP
jgi:hypothetical protein